VAHIADALLVLVLRQRRPDLQLLTWELAQPEISGLLQALGLDKDGGQLLPVELRPGGSLPALLQARQHLLQGGAVALAPEGQPTWDGRLQHPLQPGAAWLALQSGSPVVPVVSIGGYDIQPLWQTERIRLTGRMQIRSGQPFYLSEQPLLSVPADQLAQGSQSIWQAMAGLLPATLVAPVASAEQPAPAGHESTPDHAVT
jgi:1-acyl-sn-glycerol-3-phosphate acyltransferase